MNEFGTTRIGICNECHLTSHLLNDNHHCPKCVIKNTPKEIVGYWSRYQDLIRIYCREKPNFLKRLMYQYFLGFTWIDIVHIPQEPEYIIKQKHELEANGFINHF